jgi:hypothetical protein
MYHLVQNNKWRKGEKTLQGNSKYEKKDRKTKETLKNKRDGPINKKINKI